MSEVGAGKEARRTTTRGIAKAMLLLWGSSGLGAENPVRKRYSPQRLLASSECGHPVTCCVGREAGCHGRVATGSMSAAGCHAWYLGRWRRLCMVEDVVEP